MRGNGWVVVAAVGGAGRRVRLTAAVVEGTTVGGGTVTGTVLDVPVTAVTGAGGATLEAVVGPGPDNREGSSAGAALNAAATTTTPTTAHRVRHTGPLCPPTQTCGKQGSPRPGTKRGTFQGGATSMKCAQH